MCFKMQQVTSFFIMNVCYISLSRYDFAGKIISDSPGTMFWFSDYNSLSIANKCWNGTPQPMLWVVIKHDKIPAILQR